MTIRWGPTGTNQGDLWATSAYSGRLGRVRATDSLNPGPSSPSRGGVFDDPVLVGGEVVEDGIRLHRLQEADEPQLLFPCYDGLATALLDLGDEGRAEEFMQKAQAVCERAGLEPDALVVLPFLD